MLEEVLLAGERPRELDDDASGRGVAGGGDSTKTCEHLVHTSSMFLSTRLEADAARERIGWRRRGRAERRGGPLGLLDHKMIPREIVGQILYI